LVGGVGVATTAPVKTVGVDVGTARVALGSINVFVGSGVLLAGTSVSVGRGVSLGGSTVSVGTGV
jgi:hypothetical protein